MPRGIIFIAAAVALYWVLKWFYGKRDGTFQDMPNKVFMWVAVVFALGMIFGTPYWGTTKPGSFFERAEYQGMFYVLLYPNGQKVKSYRVPALVTSRVESQVDQDERSYSWREYRIEFAVMPNGGKITFYDSDELLELDGLVTMHDDQERYWGVQLTDQVVKE
jgi:hypothetical protein